MTQRQIDLTNAEMALLAAIDVHVAAEAALDVVERDIMQRDGRGKAIAADVVEHARYGVR